MDKAKDEKERLIVSEALSVFKCKKDSDIQAFLNNKAINFQNRGLCTVYLLIDAEAFKAHKIKIEAYFTLSHKYIHLEDSISGTKRKDVGFNKTDTDVHFVLIGHLGKYIDETTSSDINAKEILDKAFEVIYTAHELIACRCVLVECNDDAKVHKVYTDYEFKYLQHDGEHNQFYKRIK